MSDETEETAIRRRIEGEMLVSQRLDGVVRTLESQFRGHPQLAQDAVLEAIERPLVQIERNDVSHVLTYIQKVATSYIKKELKKLEPAGVTLDSLDAALENDSSDDVVSGVIELADFPCGHGPPIAACAPYRAG